MVAIEFAILSDPTCFLFTLISINFFNLRFLISTTFLCKFILKKIENCLYILGTTLLKTKSSRLFLYFKNNLSFFF